MKFWEVFPVVDSVVIPVNCKGIMGAGLAKAVKPYLSQEEWNYYLSLCKTAKGGDAYQGLTNRWIYAFTKQEWSLPTRIEWVEKVLQNLILISVRDKSALLCQLGCGLGGLSWEKQVKPLYDHYIPLMSWKEVYVV